MVTAALALQILSAGMPMQRTDDGSIFPGDGSFAVGSDHTHDPCIVELGGRTFCFSTGNGGTLKSTIDFNTWTDHGPIMKTPPDWLQKLIPEHRSIWAPDCIKVGKKVRIYYCASRFFGGNDSVIGLFENDHFDPEHPTNGWVDHGKIIESAKANGNHYNCIDPDVQIDQQGRHWLYFGSYYSGIYVVELDPDSGKILGKSEPISVAWNKSSKENALEGPAGCYRNGFYYLWVSYGLAAQGVRSTYQVMVGRSKSPSGPFLDMSGKPMTEGGHVNILKTSPPMFSPGHNEVMLHRDGRWMMSYHYYDGRKFWIGDKWGMPRLQVREVLWSSDDWPLPGLPVEFTNQIKLSNHKSPSGKWLHQSDFTNVEEITLTPEGVIEAGKRRGRWEVHGEKLTLKWPKIDIENDFWIDELQLAYNGNYYVGRNQSGMVIRGIRSELK